jgi:DNA-3-methyladenine glycosylase
MKLTREFFNRNTLKVAKNLLGKYLCRRIGKKVVCGMITETEAYRGEDDLACHASRGRTKRTEIMYGEPGHAYVYLCYGKHWMLNIVTEKKDLPAAVLIRSIKLAEVTPRQYVSGPGRVTNKLQIDKRFNKVNLLKSTSLWVEDKGVKIRNTQIKNTPRIGVSYAKHCSKWPWRFLLSEVSPRKAQKLDH